MLTYMMPIKMCMDLREGLTFKAKFTLCPISPPIIMRNSMDRSLGLNGFLITFEFQIFH